ncbi:MAG: DUF4154 domain-containing protein [Opitutae bacterium]|jgi:hypothetical protein|nr:DUF4154 domain-containing protein [Opitutae bacterium]
MRKLQLGLPRGMILVFAVFFSSVSVSSSGKEGLMLPLEKSKFHLVNLQVTHLSHVFKWIKWKEGDLPVAGKPVKCVIVGEDRHRFRERLSFVVAESGTSVLEHPIEFLSFGKMDEALRFTKKDASVMILVVLDSVDEEWTSDLYPNRPSFIVYGQSERFRKQGMTFCSRSIHNRLKLAVNMKRANRSGVSLSNELLKRKRIFSVDNGIASGPEEK